MNNYEILEVKPTATTAEIKKSFRRLAAIYHPDKPTGSEEKFKEIVRAYDELIVKGSTTSFKNPFKDFNEAQAQHHKDKFKDKVRQQVIYEIAKLRIDIETKQKLYEYLKRKLESM